jgi:hypothetical protein
MAAMSHATISRLSICTACGCGFFASAARHIVGSSTECSDERLWDGVAALPVGFFAAPA